MSNTTVLLNNPVTFFYAMNAVPQAKLKKTGFKEASAVNKNCLCTVTTDQWIWTVTGKLTTDN